MSVPGKGEEGSILLDVLVALFVAIIGFSALFSAMITSIDFSIKSEDKIKESIIERNHKVKNFNLILSYEK